MPGNRWSARLRGVPEHNYGRFLLKHTGRRTMPGNRWSARLRGVPEHNYGRFLLKLQAEGQCLGTGGQPG